MVGQLLIVIIDGARVSFGQSLHVSSEYHIVTQISQAVERTGLIICKKVMVSSARPCSLRALWLRIRW